MPILNLARRAIFDKGTMQTLDRSRKRINRKFLKIEEVVGHGFFGNVFKGQLTSCSEQRIVAIKTIKSQPSGEILINAAKSLLAEAAIMIDIDHKNVMHLIGVAVFNNMPNIVLPFMANGDLFSYLREESNVLKQSQLIGFAIDIAEGMSYLSQQRITHRDLAARNCMLDDNLVVKVSDFGLSRDVLHRNYYRSIDDAHLPLKWMAPESMSDNFFDTKTDCWSYGVTLWEIMSRGQEPYAGVINLLLHLKQGYRLEARASCPTQIRDLMYECWNVNRVMRPQFNMIAIKLRDIQEALREVDILVLNHSQLVYSHVFHSELHSEEL